MILFWFPCLHNHYAAIVRSAYVFVIKNQQLYTVQYINYVCIVHHIKKVWPSDQKFGELVRPESLLCGPKCTLSKCCHYSCIVWLYKYTKVKFQLPCTCKTTTYALYMTVSMVTNIQRDAKTSGFKFLSQS